MITRSIVAVLAACALTTLSTPSAQASDTTVAVCGVDGCTCSLSAVSAEDFILTFGNGDAGAPVDATSATLVIDTEYRTVFWSDASREAIDHAYGGAGECPIELFPDEPVVPHDGLWRWNTIATSTSGCPSMLASMFADPAALGTSHTARVNWNGRFDPTRLADHEGMSIYRWLDRGRDNWTTVPVAERTCEDGTCSSVALQLWMSLVSETRASGHLAYTMEISGGGGATLGSHGAVGAGHLRAGQARMALIAALATGRNVSDLLI